MGKDIIIDSPEEKKLRREIEGRAAKGDAEAARMLRFLEMPDLSRTPGSPLFEIVKRAREIPVLKGFDNIIIPEIVPADISFDLFDFPPDHPARKRSDTYYVDDNDVLRTHDTVMWYYYTQLPEIKERIARGEKFGVVCYGKVYRKDELDRNHMNVFHQFGGWYLAPSSAEPLALDDLKEALGNIVRGLYGEDARFRFLDDTFPYTDPSLQVEVWIGPGAPSTESSDERGPDGGRWIEILGGGMTKQDVFKNFGVEGYNAWAFGFGLDRLAIISMELPDIRLLWSKDPRVTRQLKLGQKYKEVSKYPPVTRDISFIVGEDFVPNDYFDVIRDTGGDLVEEVSLIDKYEDEKKFGAGKASYAYRVVYRSPDRTLTSDEVDGLHHALEKRTAELFRATVR